LGPVHRDDVLPVGAAKSPREIHERLPASESKLRHLGLRDAASRSTLA